MYTFKNQNHCIYDISKNAMLISDSDEFYMDNWKHGFSIKIIDLRTVIDELRRINPSSR